MSPPCSAKYSDSPLALLALQRWVRGVLKPLTMGILSLMLMLGVRAYFPSATVSAGVKTTVDTTAGDRSEATFQPHSSSSLLRLGRIETRWEQAADTEDYNTTGKMAGHRSDPTERKLATRTATEDHRFAHILGANMTHHHLTSSRLSVSSERNFR